MDQQSRYPRWAPWAAAALVSMAVGVAAYSFGVERAAADAATGAVHVHRHGFFPFGLFFGLFWIFLLVRLFAWGGWWGGRRYYHGGPAWYDDPARWDEWHRRAHEHLSRPQEPDGHDTRR